MEIYAHAADAWFENAETIGRRLDGITDRAQARTLVQEIVSGGESVLRRIGDTVTDDIIARVHVRLAAAQADLARLSDDDGSRNDHLRAVVDHTDLASSAAFATEITFIPAHVVASLTGILDGAMALASGRQKSVIGARRESLERQAHTVIEQMRAERRRGAEGLFVTRMALLTAEANRGDPDRTQALTAAREVAKAALRDLVSSGDFETARDARGTLAQIEAALA